MFETPPITETIKSNRALANAFFSAMKKKAYGESLTPYESDVWACVAVRDKELTSAEHVAATGKFLHSDRHVIKHLREWMKSAVLKMVERK